MKDFKKKLEERESYNYHVDVIMRTNIVNASIEFTESITRNGIYAVCYPNLIEVKEVRVDNVIYEIDDIIDMKIRDLETGKIIRSKKEIEYVKTVANEIIEKGNQYLKNIFGNNLSKEVLKLQ